MTAPAPEETEAEPKRRGAAPYTRTALARALDRAERRVHTLERNSGVDKAKERLERAQASYDEALEKAQELPSAREAYEQAKYDFENFVAPKSNSEEE